MTETDCVLTTDDRPRAEPCTLLVEARVVQNQLAGLGESLMVGDADALDVEDTCADAAAMVGRLIEALADARKAASRLPPSPRPAGLPPVPPPAPWQPSGPSPAPAPAKPSRRGVLVSAAGLLALGAVPAAGAAAVSPDDRDAELIALCEEYTALDRAFTRNGHEQADLRIGSPECEALWEEGVAMVPRLHELEASIAATRPHTERGRWVKLRAARRSMVSDGDAAEPCLLDEDADLALSAIEDFLTCQPREGA